MCVISMTVGERGRREGVLARVISEIPGQDHAIVELSERRGIINADLTVGPNVVPTRPLKANEGLSSRGVALHGAGFIVSLADAHRLGLGRIPGIEKHIRPYRHGRDVTQRPRNLMIIDVDGLPIEDVRSRFPEVFQHLLSYVKPEQRAIAARKLVDVRQTEHRPTWLLKRSTSLHFNSGNGKAPVFCFLRSKRPTG